MQPPKFKITDCHWELHFKNYMTQHFTKKKNTIINVVNHLQQSQQQN